MLKRLFARTFVVAVALAAPLAMAQFETAQAAKAPRLTLTEGIKDFGTVAKGETLNWSFEHTLPKLGREGQNQYRIEITVDGDQAPVGPLAEKIHVVTNSKHQPDYWLSVSGIVRRR
jgi:hypothetical protein